jgi:lipid II:glycine glycyltransferase (peptidoglycan interpeptide bridge formation enzyme)
MPTVTFSTNNKLEFDLFLSKETNFEYIDHYKFETGESFIFFQNKQTPVYPMQTLGWAMDFWLVEKNSVPNHKAFLINVSGNISHLEDEKNFESPESNLESNLESINWIQAIVYQYPWHFGEVFLTIPRGPVCSFGFANLSIETQTKLITDFKSELDKLAISTGATFIKIEPTWDGSQNLNLTNQDSSSEIAQLDYELNSKLFNQFCLERQVNKKTKFLQPPYSRTIQIQIPILKNVSKPSSLESFQEIFDTYFEAVVSHFESKTRYNARLAKKKGLQVFWDKSEQAFEDFWKVMESTADRQEFVPYSKAYYQNVLKNDWADLVLVKTSEGKVTNVWMGSFTAGMGMYLYGGSDLSFSSLKGAEFIHAAAMIRTLQMCGKLLKTQNEQDAQNNQNNLELIYDMGGSSLLDGALPAWDGYSKFKKGFGGKIVEYLPHSFDVIYKSNKYFMIDFLIHTIKPILAKLRHYKFK